MVCQYLKEAKKKIKVKSNNIVLVLCCTHFQFIKSVFKQVAQDIFEANIVILNPNEVMPKVIPLEQEVDDMENVSLINKVYSNMEITAEEILHIGTAIHKDAPPVYQALKNYCLLSTFY